MIRFLFVRSSFLRLSLLGSVLVALAGGCGQQGDEVKQAGNAIRQFAAKQNPALRVGQNRFSGTLNATDGDVCACMQVCDSHGQNCTACSCSPAGCGSC
jgi:hypothetical protein